MLEERIDRQASPLTSIPDKYKPLIAKLAHERYEGSIELIRDTSLMYF